MLYHLEPGGLLVFVHTCWSARCAFKTSCLTLPSCVLASHCPLIYAAKQVQALSLHLACICALVSTIVDRVGREAIGPSYFNRQNSTAAFFSLIWGFHALAYIGRIYNRKWAKNGVKGDKTMYDDMWRTETGDEAGKSAVEDLDHLIQSTGLVALNGMAFSATEGSSRSEF